MRSRLFPAMTLCLALQACAGLPAGSLQALSRIDPATTDAAQLRVAFYAPPELRIREEDARFTFTYRNRRQNFEAKQDFALQEVADDGDRAGLPQGPAAPGVLHIFRLRPEEAQRLDAARRAMLAQKQKGDRTEGTVSVSASGCVRRDAGQALLISGYLKTVETRGYVLVLEALDVRKAAGRAGAPPLQRCPAEGTAHK